MIEIGENLALAIMAFVIGLTLVGITWVNK